MSQHLIVLNTDWHQRVSISLTCFAPWSLVDQHMAAAWQSLQQAIWSFATTSCRLPRELQLVNLRAGNQVIAIANIYRPPSNPKFTVLVELNNLLSSFCIQPVNRLLLCGDVNLLGQRDSLVDEYLLAVLVQFGMEQHAKEPIHYAVSINHENVFDLVVTPENSTLVRTTSIVTSHHLSHHRLVICDLNFDRHKRTTQICMVQNIKAIDRADIERRMLHSSIFTDPAVTTEEFLSQIERKVTVVLDVVAPLCRARYHGII